VADGLAVAVFYASLAIWRDKFMHIKKNRNTLVPRVWPRTFYPLFVAWGMEGLSEKPSFGTIRIININIPDLPARQAAMAIFCGT